MQSFKLSHLLVLLAVVTLTGCEKVPLTSPTGSTITLSIDKTSVPIGGTAQLTAVVSEVSGTAPQNGTMVTFNSAFGTITPQEAPTVGGIARATFTGTASGTAKVGAFSGPAKATEVELKVGGAAAERLTLRSEPSTLPANGGTVTIVANVQDAAGGILPNTPVNFSTDNGTLSSNTVNTDATGEARVQLNTNRTSKVTAAVGSKTADFTITALPAPAVTVTGCSATPVVGVAVNCTFTPTVPTGGAPITNVTVNWGDGTGDQSLGPITGATTASHVYTRSDNFTVTATATDANGQRGTGSAAVNVNRSLPTVTIACPAGNQVAGSPGSFLVTPPNNPAIQTQNITVDFSDGTSRNLGTPTGPTSFTKSFGAEGGYTATATITDVAGQRGSASCSVIVGRAASPTVTLTQSGTISGGVGTFTVGATAASGATIQSVVVRHQDGRTLYSGSSGSTFVANGLAINDILTATATDSLGATGTAQLAVR